MQTLKSKLSGLPRGLYQPSYRRVIAILIVLLCLGLGVAVVGTYSLSMNLVESQAMQYASVAVKTLNEARKLYSKNVVNRVKSTDGVEVTPEYHTISGGIPNPATYTIELGDRLSDRSRGMLFRLYSDFPFPNREGTGGAQDRFEREALAYLMEHPKDSFYRKERLGDRFTFRYTEAVLMEPSCVACHNKLPNSPKRNWKVGQLRGVVEIVQPLDEVILIARDGLKAIYTTLVIIIALAISGLVLVIERFHRINQDLEEKVAERTAALYRLATLDDLTQLANRRQFDRILDREWQRSRNKRQPLSLILCDVDYFKKYNDTYGHQAGDDCLRAIARVLQNSIHHDGEAAVRYGGEEFAIVLPNANSVEATQMAVAIGNAIRRLRIPHETSLNGDFVTLSMGVATIVPHQNSCCKHLVKAADEALYQAKGRGRDRFAVWQQG